MVAVEKLAHIFLPLLKTLLNFLKIIFTSNVKGLFMKSLNFFPFLIDLPLLIPLSMTF